MSGYLPKEDGGKKAFKDADIIVIPAGIPREFVGSFLGRAQGESEQQTSLTTPHDIQASPE